MYTPERLQAFIIFLRSQCIPKALAITQERKHTLRTQAKRMSLFSLHTVYHHDIILTDSSNK